MKSKVKAKKKVPLKAGARKDPESKIEKTVAKTLKNKSFSAPAQRKGRTMTSRLSSKNQLTLPVDIVREAGFKIGEELGFSVMPNGHISIHKLEPKILRLVGAGNGLFDDFDLEAERADAWPE